ncbi:MAG: hypothetical protein ACRCSK_08280 [Fusobacteriaceae bacterium]
MKKLFVVVLLFIVGAFTFVNAEEKKELIEMSPSQIIIEGELKVVVIGEDRKNIDISYDFDDDKKLIVSQNEKVLKLTSPNKMYKFKFLDFMSKNHITVRTPKNVSIDVSSDNSKVNITNIIGNIFVDTNNGGVELKDVTGNAKIVSSNASVSAENISGNTNLKTVNGKIVAKNIGGIFDAKTSNGKIEVSNISMLSSLDTSNGKIIAEINGITKDSSISSSNGSIKLKLNITDTQIKVSTSNGTINLIGKNSKLKLKSDSSFIIGNTKKNNLEINTSNSDIEIESKIPFSLD